MHLDFGKIIQRAFEITKNNRPLWLFGALVALTSGEGFNLIGNIPTDFGGTKEPSHFLPPVFPKIDLTSIFTILVVVAILAFVLWLLAIFISSLSNGALIDMVDKIEQDQSVTIKEGFSAGFGRALPLILISLVIFIPFILAILLLAALLVGPGILLIVAKKTTIGIVLTVIGGIIWLLSLIGGSIYLGLVSLFANRFYVLRDLGIIQSIVQGNSLLRKNLGPTLMLWLINVGIGIGLGIALLVVYALVLVILGVILGLPIYLLASNFSNWLYLLLLIPGLLFIIAAVFANGLVQTFFSSYWTLAFRKLCNS